MGVRLTGQDDTQVNEGSWKAGGIPDHVPAQNGTRMSLLWIRYCVPRSKLTNTGTFTRQAAAGSFQSKSNATGDFLPPSRVLDLSRYLSPCGPVSLTFTYQDNLDSPDSVKEYVVKYALTQETSLYHDTDNGTNEKVSCW